MDSKFAGDQIDLDRALVEAVEDNDIDQARALHKQGASPNAFEGEAIACAAENGRMDMLKSLCEDMGGKVLDSQCDDNTFRWSVSKHFPEVVDYLDKREAVEGSGFMKQDGPSSDGAGDAKPAAKSKQNLTS